MHGGAWGSGAPLGNSNAVKHGYFTGEAIEERKFVRTVLAEAEKLLDWMDRSPTTEDITAIEVSTFRRL